MNLLKPKTWLLIGATIVMVVATAMSAQASVIGCPTCSGETRRVHDAQPLSGVSRGLGRDLSQVLGEGSGYLRFPTYDELLAQGVNPLGADHYDYIKGLGTRGLARDPLKGLNPSFVFDASDYVWRDAGDYESVPWLESTGPRWF